MEMKGGTYLDSWRRLEECRIELKAIIENLVSQWMKQYFVIHV
jgi:hypothetical protein